MAFARSRQALAIAGVLGLALGATACGTGNDKKSSKASSPECAAYEKYQGHDGKKVTIYSSIRDIEADRLKQSWKQFEDCTGIKIDHEGSGEFEAQLGVRVDGGNAPDLAFIPQPGLLKRFADSGKLKPAGADTKAMAEQNYSPDWLKYGTVDGKFYGAPLGANVKSFVWYSPKIFKEKGWTVPTTWDELITLSDTIAASGIKPWCAGIESGDGHRLAGHRLDRGHRAAHAGSRGLRPVGHPRASRSTTRRSPTRSTQAGTILKNDKYVNGGFGDVKTHRHHRVPGGRHADHQGQVRHAPAGVVLRQPVAKGTKVAEDGDVFAFYFPAIDPTKGKPVLGGGEFVAAFTDRPEVQAVQIYLASGEYANSRVKLGDWVSANKKLDIDNVHRTRSTSSRSRSCRTRRPSSGSTART